MIMSCELLYCLASAHIFLMRKFGLVRRILFFRGGIELIVPTDATAYRYNA